MKEKKRKKKTEKNIKRFQFHWQNAEKSHKIAKQNLHASSAERRIVYTCIYRHDLHWYVQVPCLPMMLVAISWLILFQCYVTSHKHTHSSLALSKWKKRKPHSLYPFSTTAIDDDRKNCTFKNMYTGYVCPIWIWKTKKYPVMYPVQRE